MKICYNGGTVVTVVVLWSPFGGSTVPGSSMVEQEAVNFEVAGSSPVPGAMLDESPQKSRMKEALTD